MLKNENILNNYNGDFDKIDINFDNDIVSIYYDGSLTEEEKQLLIKEKDRLINSIERRKKLLSNQGYINKAPKQIVENEKNSLIKDEKDLKFQAHGRKKYFFYRVMHILPNFAQNIGKRW